MAADTSAFCFRVVIGALFLVAGWSKARKPAKAVTDWLSAIPLVPHVLRKSIAKLIAPADSLREL